MPGNVIVELVHAINYWLNMFPANNGVSSTQSPRHIMTGQSCNYHLHGQLQFGEYAQVHESHDNTIWPTGNIQGGYFLMSLSSSKCLNQHSWTALPMPGEAINRVHALAHRNPAGGNIVFGWRDGTKINNAPHDSDDLHDEDYYIPDEDPEADNNYSAPYRDAGSDDDLQSSHDSGSNGGNDGESVPATGVGTGHSAENDGAHDKEYNENSASVADTNDPDQDQGSNTDGEGDIDGDAISVASSANTGVQADVEPARNTGVEADMDFKYGPRTQQGMQPQKQSRSPTKIKTPQSSAHYALNLMIGHELGGLSTFPII